MSLLTSMFATSAFERTRVIDKCLSAAKTVGSIITEEEMTSIVDFALKKISEGVKNQYFKARTTNGKSIARSIDILDGNKFIIHLNQTKTDFNGYTSDPETFSKTRNVQAKAGAPDKILGSGNFKVAKYSIDSDGIIIARCTAKLTFEIEREIERTWQLNKKISTCSTAQLLYVMKFQSKLGTQKVEMLFPLYNGHLADRMYNLNKTERLKVAHALITFIQEAHAKGHTHGDLFPRNVFLDPILGVIIADFGNCMTSSDRYYEEERQKDIELLANFLIDLFRHTSYEWDVRDLIRCIQMKDAKKDIQNYVNSLRTMLNDIKVTPCDY